MLSLAIGFSTFWNVLSMYLIKCVPVMDIANYLLYFVFSAGDELVGESLRPGHQWNTG